MDRKLVAERAGDGGMDGHLALKLREVADVVDALLELAAEARGDGGDLHAAARQLVRHEVVLHGRGGRHRFIDRNLEIDGLAFDVLLVDGDGMVDRLAVDEACTLELLGAERDGLSLHGERLAELDVVVGERVILAGEGRSGEDGALRGGGDALAVVKL